MASEDVDKLITFGQMALEQGWYEQAREYFEQALVLDASNREAMKGFARVNEILSRRASFEPARPEVVPVKPTSVEPVRPPYAGEPTAKQNDKRRWLALAVIPVLLLVFTFAYQRIEPMLQPAPTALPTVTPRPTSTPRPLPTLRPSEEYKCELAAVGYNNAVKIELFLVEFGWSWVEVQLHAINISSRTVYVGPGSFIVVDGTGASCNYTQANFRGSPAGVDLAPGTYTTGWLMFGHACMEGPQKLVYDGGLYDPIVLNISRASCVRVKR